MNHNSLTGVDVIIFSCCFLRPFFMSFSGIILIGKGSKSAILKFNIPGANVADEVDGIESTAMDDVDGIGCIVADDVNGIGSVGERP